MWLYWPAMCNLNGEGSVGWSGDRREGGREVLAGWYI